jgi:hypothetical protein
MQRSTPFFCHAAMQHFIPKLTVCLVIVATAFSCRRSETKTDIDCISRYWSSPNQALLAQRTLDSIDALFGKNNLPISGLQFLYILYDTTSNPTGYSGPQIQVSANPFINNIPVYQEDEYFTFDSTGLFQPSNSVIYAWSPPGQDTSTRQTLEGLRQIFLNDYKLCVIEGGTENSTPTHPTAPYGDSCLLAMLVYSDANTFNRKIPPGTQLVLAWNVTGLNKGYPSVLVEDSTGLAIPAAIILP